MPASSICKAFFAGLVLAVGMLLTASNAANGAAVVNYGDANAPHFWRQLAALEHGYGEEVRIVQLGDSHTGGDYFTQSVRERLQQRFGYAGIGWLTPGYVKNQRSAQVLMRMSGQWKTRVSHGEPDNFPLGGVVNQAGPGAAIEIVPKAPLNGLLRVSIWTRRAGDAPAGGWTLTFPDGEVRELAPAFSNDWQVSYVIGNGNDVNSLLLRASGNPPELGAITVDAIAPGVTVDALGIVGATQKVITNWQPEAVRDQLGWRRPDLVILSYGTNEAFDIRFDVEGYRADLRRTIRELRDAAPNAAILLIGAPDAGKKTGKGVRVGCRYDLPAALRAVQEAQRQVAREERLLYWDWAAAMGGACAMQEFAESNPPLGRPDLIHFTEEGYARSGVSFYDALMESYARGR
jgi:lysophospholipase L1-like esterase